MKPLNATNNDGRVLLALRAGAMTSGEFSERGLSVSGWLVKEGLVEQGLTGYRITEAGRVACPLRNPLAAPKAQPATQEPTMAREKIVSRQDVLAAIVAAGPAGTTPKALIEQFGCGDQAMYNHVMLLGKQIPPVIFKPEKGRLVAIQFNDQPAAFKPAPAKPLHATRAAVLAFLQGKDALSVAAIATGLNCTEDSTKAVLLGLYSGLQVDREHVGDAYFYFIPKPKAAEAPVATKEKQLAAPAVTSAPETPKPEAVITPPIAAEAAPEVVVAIEEMVVAAAKAGITEPDASLSPAIIIPKPELEDFATGFGEVVYNDPEGVDFGIWSNGALTFDDGEITVQLSGAVTKKLRSFLGLFNEAA